MPNKKKMSFASIAVLLLGLLAVNFVMASTPTAASTIEKESVASVIAEKIPEAIEKLKPLIPETPEEAETSIYPSRNRFLLWTNNGVHIMWGTYGNRIFVGTDNLGKRCWGIYGREFFAGFYDGEFFWGRYSNGAWRAQYLFGIGYSSGKYVLFRNPTLATEYP